MFIQYFTATGLLYFGDSLAEHESGVLAIGIRFLAERNTRPAKAARGVYLHRNGIRKHEPVHLLHKRSHLQI